MKITVGTAASAVPSETGRQPMIQNLGPGTVFISNDDGVTTDTGLRLSVGDVLEISESAATGNTSLFLIADAAATDVRILFL